MAVFVTNPRRRNKRRSNGALNQLIAKKIGVNIRTEAGRKAVADYKRSAGYKLGGGMGAELEKARKAKKARTAESKAFTKKTGKSKTAAFIERVKSQKAGKKAAASAPAAKKSAGETKIVKAKSGREMYYLNGKLVSKATYEAAVGAAAPAAKKGGRRKAAASAPAAKASGVMFTSKGQPYIKTAEGKTKFISKAEAEKMGASAGGKKKNPYGFFARRRNAGALESATSFLRGQLNLRSLAYTGGTAVTVGVAHAYLAPMISDAVVEYGSKIPVVGEYVAKVGEMAPYTVTGLLAGAVVAGAGAALNLSPMLYGSAAVLALTSGVVMDTVGAVGAMRSEGSSDVAGIAYSGLAYSGVAVQNPSYGGVAVQNPGYGAMEDEQAVMAEYGDAQESDAYMSGDDFDDEEGQALIDGPRAFFMRFGRPARVASRIRGPYSRHAGRRGHRWAWLIKLVGFRKAAEIAALPAERRLSVLSALRRQAVESLPALMAKQANVAQIAQNNTYSVNMADAGAEGATGASGYGALVYAGAGY